MRPRLFCVLLVLMFCMAFVPEMRAKSTAAQTLNSVQYCKNATKTQRDSGITAEMVDGWGRYAQCLEGVSNQLAAKFYPNSAAFKHTLSRTIENLYTLHGTIYSGPKECYQIGCGTMYYAMPAGTVSGFLEDLIIEMVTRNEYTEESEEASTESWQKAIKTL